MRSNTPDQWKEAEKNFEKKVLGRIANLMKVRQVTQKQLAEACKFSTAATSKIMKGDTNLSISHLYRISSALEIDPDMLVEEGDNALDEVESTRKYLQSPQNVPDSQCDRGSLIRKYLENLKEDKDKYADSILYDPSRPAFKGIINDAGEDDVYYIYIKPTIRDEKQAILKGKLKLTAVTGENPYCKARFELDTGRISRDGKPVLKYYDGEMLISLPMRTCYILLFSPISAEINMISFQHMFLNNQKLACRLGAVLTTSAGANRRPTMEKCIISRVELNDEVVSELEGQLFINSSNIRVSKALLDQPEYSEIKEKLLQIMGFNVGPGRENNMEFIEQTFVKSYYELDELVIRASAVLSSKEKIDMINKLRKLSDNPRYCKVSSNADDNLYSYLCDLLGKYSFEY